MQIRQKRSVKQRHYFPHKWGTSPTPRFTRL